MRKRDVVGYEVNGYGNRPCALYGQAGIIDVTKKDLQDCERRKSRHVEPPARLAGKLSILEEQADLFEKLPEAAEENVAERVRGHELTPCIMSIPGIWTGIAAALPAYPGDRSRF
ncbi:MAG: hypothetical protein LBB48_04925, partial [Treponema sp.]|nr:hypothetical protein [Treponema sp.]